MQLSPFRNEFGKKAIRNWQQVEPSAKKDGVDKYVLDGGYYQNNKEYFNADFKTMFPGESKMSFQVIGKEPRIGLERGFVVARIIVQALKGRLLYTKKQKKR